MLNDARMTPATRCALIKRVYKLRHTNGKRSLNMARVIVSIQHSLLLSEGKEYDNRTRTKH